MFKLPSPRRIISSIVSDRGSRWLLWGGVINNVAQWLMVLLFVPRDAQWLPLHYNIYFGIDLTGPWRLMFLLPALGLVTMLVCVFGATRQSNPTWTKSWLVVAVVIGALLTVALGTLVNKWSPLS